jgi:hypothetical protein
VIVVAVVAAVEIDMNVKEKILTEFYSFSLHICGVPKEHHEIPHLE